jgi:hypothetical protein
LRSAKLLLPPQIHAQKDQKYPRFCLAMLIRPEIFFSLCIQTLFGRLFAA